MICAFDCDLRESFCVDDLGNTGRGPDPRAAWDSLICAVTELPRHDIFLFEIASPVSFNRGAAGHAAMTQLAKWAIWNAAQAMAMHMRFHHNYPGQKVLVSPSNLWTKGFDLHTRHMMAGAKQKKKDLRECECMIFMYKHNPTAWKPLPDYLATL